MNHKRLLIFVSFISFISLICATPALALDLPIVRRVATPSAKISTPAAKLILPLMKIAKFKGNIEALGANYLIADGKKVNFDSKTILLRKYGGKSAITEFSMGDGVQVIGNWTSDAKTEVNARVIRDFSIQKRHAVFIGTVKSLKPETAELVLTTLRRGDQDVAPDKNTKYVDREMRIISFDKLKVNDRIRVKGTWDSKLSQIFEVTQIKDYSLPVKLKTASPSAQQ